MRQSLYGLLLFAFLAAPPVAYMMESVMVVHMHMQMPMLVIAGVMMARIFMLKFPDFFAKWNDNGIAGILLFFIVWTYWMMPRTMDEALTEPMMEVFKFISLPFLAGIPLRDSWPRLSQIGRQVFLVALTIQFIAIGWLYIASPDQLCNNYLLIEQITLGWAFLLLAIALIIFMAVSLFLKNSEYE